MTLPESNLTMERLREVLSYNPVTGLFTWIKSINNRAPVGAIAGARQTNGYTLVTIDRRGYQAHRLAWFYVHGKWPAEYVDHINGVVDDNRFCNLREASREENMRNAKLPCTNKSGFKGVIKEPNSRKWRAQIRINGKRKYLGAFETPEKAHTAYCVAARKYHGKFARFS